MKTDTKFARKAEDIEADYLAFGFSLFEGRARLSRGKTHSLRHLIKLGLNPVKVTPEQLAGGRLFSDLPLHVTHAQYAKTNAHFIEKCKAVGVAPTKRQASKFRRGLGRAAQPFLIQKVA
jgi:hypothetical protein